MAAVTAKLPTAAACAVAGALISTIAPALAQQSPPGSRLEALLRDAETAAGLSASGRLFYNADAEKKDWGQYCTISRTLADRGEFRQAVREASKALFLGQISNNTTALTYASRDLAYAYSLAGELEKAEEWAKRSLTYLSRSGVRHRNEVLVPVHQVLGDIASRRNDIDAAVKHYRTALSELGGFDPRRVPLRISMANAEMRRGRIEAARQILNDIGTDDGAWAPFVSRARGQLAFAERNYAKAVEFFAAAAAGMRQAEDPYHLMWLLHGLARAHLALGDHDKALTALRDAIASAKNLRARFRSEEFKAGFFGDVQRIFDDAIGLLVDAKRFDEALALSEESRARALLDILKGKVEVEQLDTAHAIARAPQGTAIAVYHVLPDRTIAWTVRSGAITTAIIPAGRKQLSVLTGRFRRAIFRRGSDTREQGRKLYELLVQPLGLNPAESLIVVPHKALHYLPWQALDGPQGFLIEERSVATVPSLNAMLALGDRGGQVKPTVFALGNPDLEDPALALPGAEQEVKTIGGLFADARIFVRHEASRPRFLSQAPGNGVIHVASHATVDEIDPLYSSIRLARAGQPRGEVEAHEILGLDLSAARVVTLSGCESGLGKVNDGDEFFGFKRTFLAAGARSLLVSLWPVEDESTANLMAVFYRELRERPMIEALRRAQLSLLKSATHGDPMFWAPFVLVGDWR
ncbi:MAG TPA: CHAT domain-containing protein [Burkholderiales bacterium]|nr:CHAT domain-containing protein [Burkholderiales bacterium]